MSFFLEQFESHYEVASRRRSVPTLRHLDWAHNFDRRSLSKGDILGNIGVVTQWPECSGYEKTKYGHGIIDSLFFTHRRNSGTKSDTGIPQRSS